ncbi:hypothetical protein PAXRUDRAFT_830593, partial [Paxillus rubicundulus Ve08.2h10]
MPHSFPSLFSFFLPTLTFMLIISFLIPPTSRNILLSNYDLGFIDVLKIQTDFCLISYQSTLARSLFVICDM